MQKRALISDFDGTITKKDFFWLAIEQLLTPTDAEPWQEYLKSNITHVEALRRIFSKIRLSEKHFRDFILNIPIEDGFLPTVEFCKENNIDFYIISAGADYYINTILEHLGILDYVTLYSNKSLYSQEKGLQILETDKNKPFYSNNYGINKKTILESLMNKYHPCLFAGDGGPDLEAAKIADYVFARDRLLELCIEIDIKAEKFSSYYDILNFLKK